LLPSLPILVTVLLEGLCVFGTSVLTRATRRNIPEDAIIHVHSVLHKDLNILSFNGGGMTYKTWIPDWLLDLCAGSALVSAASTAFA
jgi:hypothetical protein